MLAGRRYFYAIAGLMLLFAMAKVIPWLLREWRSDGPSFGLYDMRSENNLPPYQPTNSDTTQSITVFRPTFSYSYESRNAKSPPPRAGIPPPIAIIDQPATEEVILPDGHRIRLRAILAYPQVHPGENRPLSVEEVFLHPTGRWMTREEGEQIFGEMKPGWDPNEVWNPTSDNGLPYTLELLVETDLEPHNLRALGLFDTVTGGREASNISGALPINDQVDERGVRTLRLGTLLYTAVRPTPLAIHLWANQGEESVFSFLPKEPQHFEWQGQTHFFRGITVPRIGNNTYVEEYYSGEPPKKPPIHHVSMRSGSFKIMFDSLPPRFGFVYPTVFTHNGETLPPHSGGGHQFVYRGHPDEIDRIELRVMPDVAYVVLRLPTLPLVPEENRRTENLLDMVLPPAVITDDWKWQNLMSALLQASYGNPMLQTRLKLAYPIDVGGKTVGELLAMEHRRYGEHEVATTRLSHDAVVSRYEVGFHLRVENPLLAKVLTAFDNLLPWFFGLFGILTLLKIISLARATTLRRALRLRGYEELTIWDVEFLQAQLGARAWNLPRREELATIPGIDANSPESITALMRQPR